MKRYKLVVLYSPLEGRDDDFNRWLDDVHIPDLLKVEGITAAQRLKLALTQTTPANFTDHQYLTLYDIETDDIEQFHAHLMAGRVNRVSSDSVDRSNNSSRYFEVLYDRTADDPTDDHPADGHPADGYPADDRA